MCYMLELRERLSTVAMNGEVVPDDFNERHSSQMWCIGCDGQ